MISDAVTEEILVDEVRLAVGLASHDEIDRFPVVSGRGNIAVVTARIAHVDISRIHGDPRGENLLNASARVRPERIKAEAARIESKVITDEGDVWIAMRPNRIDGRVPRVVSHRHTVGKRRAIVCRDRKNDVNELSGRCPASSPNNDSRATGVRDNANQDAPGSFAACWLEIAKSDELDTVRLRSNRRRSFGG